MSIRDLEREVAEEEEGQRMVDSFMQTIARGRAVAEEFERREREHNGGEGSSGTGTGTWAQPIGNAGGRSRWPTNPITALGGLLDSAVVADETSVEKATVHPVVEKRKKLIKEMRIKERFQKPTVDGLKICPLCEWGPIGSQDLDSGDTPELTQFDEMYRYNVGKMNWHHMYRKLQEFWNDHIATQPSEMHALGPDAPVIPKLLVCDLQYHYEKCCRTRNMEHILLTQIDKVLLLQEGIENNGLYVIAVDADEQDEPQSISASDAMEGIRPTKRPKPLVNHKSANTWRELNRSLIYTIKAYADFRNVDYQIPSSVSAKSGAGTKRKRGEQSSTGIGVPGPTQRDRATFGKNY